MKTNIFTLSLSDLLITWLIWRRSVMSYVKKKFSSPEKSLFWIPSFTFGDWWRWCSKTRIGLAIGLAIELDLFWSWVLSLRKIYQFSFQDNIMVTDIQYIIYNKISYYTYLLLLTYYCYIIHMFIIYIRWGWVVLRVKCTEYCLVLFGLYMIWIRKTINLRMKAVSKLDFPTKTGSFQTEILLNCKFDIRKFVLSAK